MSRPGFVLDVDDRTPPLMIPDGYGFRTEKLPLGSKVIYSNDPLDAVPHVGAAIDQALAAPVESTPLAERLRPGMSLTITFSDITRPQPAMREPDVRGRIIEQVLTLAAAAGVDDVVLIAATGINRRLTPDELQRIVGERVFRSFHAQGALVNHDAEDADQLTSVGTTSRGVEVSLNRRVVESDLVVNVVLATESKHCGARSVLDGLAATGTVRALTSLNAPAELGDEAAGVVAGLEIFQVEAALDNHAYPTTLDFAQRREWEWSLRERTTFDAVRRGLPLTLTRARRRLFDRAVADYGVTKISAGSLAEVGRRTAAHLDQQNVVEVGGQADVLVTGVGAYSPYSVDSILNPVLAAAQGVGATFAAHRGRPAVREGGAMIIFDPARQEFNPRHHPSHVDFFSDVLSETTDAAELQDKYEARFAEDAWYRHLYRTSNAHHGVHPFGLWYQVDAAVQHCSDIVWVGGRRDTIERLGFRAASTLADALEIVVGSVGRSPQITLAHDGPRTVAGVS
ncbi:MAG: lactate racemase domain-containing protein [Propionibacteriaceae bacterium]